MPISSISSPTELSTLSEDTSFETNAERKGPQDYLHSKRPELEEIWGSRHLLPLIPDSVKEEAYHDKTRDYLMSRLGEGHEADLIEDLLNANPGRTAFVGPGWGRMFESGRTNDETLIIDIDRSVLQEAIDDDIDGTFVQADLVNLPFKDKSLEVLAMSAVARHLTKDQRVGFFEQSLGASKFSCIIDYGKDGPMIARELESFLQQRNKSIPIDWIKIGKPDKFNLERIISLSKNTSKERLIVLQRNVKAFPYTTYMAFYSLLTGFEEMKELIRRKFNDSVGVTELPLKLRRLSRLRQNLLEKLNLNEAQLENITEKERYDLMKDLGELISDKNKIQTIILYSNP